MSLTDTDIETLRAALSTPPRDEEPTEAEMVLPCDVKLPPATTIAAGCKLSTLIDALKCRGMWKHHREGAKPNPSA